MNVHLEVKDTKAKFFIELINNFDFVKVKRNGKSVAKKAKEEYKEPTKEEIKAGIRRAFAELKLIEQGKKKARPIKELLDEL